MALIQESYIQSLLTECDQLVPRQERQAREALIKKLDKVHEIIKDNVRQSFNTYSFDVLVRFSEIAVEIPSKFEQAANIVDLFFERVNTSNQFYIRELLVKAKVIAYNSHIKSQKGQQMLVSLKEAITYISKALDLISPQQQVAGKGKDPKGAQGADSTNKSKYSFLIYNASTTLYKVTRFLLRSGWQKAFADIYERIYKLLEEVDEPDHNWRSRFSMVLYQCLYDADRKPDAFKILDTLWEKTKNKPCEFQDSLFRLRVYLSKENNALTATIKKDIEGADPNGWKILQPLQRMRSGLIPEAQIEKELMTIVNQISLGVLSTNETSAHQQLSNIMQERLAEAGRIALRFNLTNLANSIVSYLGKTRQPSQRALVLNEYNKAELLIKKKGEYVDKKTGMSMSVIQIKELQIQNRKQALKIMEKVMLINKKLDNAQLIYEGSILVWNIALPFLTQQYYSFSARALDISLSLLEQIDTNDHDLRTKIHLQLINIYFNNDLMFAEVEANVFKALRLDPSIPTAKLPVKPQPQEDPSLYSQPYNRYLLDFRQKVLLKTMQINEPTALDIVTQDLWTIQDHKSETTKIDTLQKCLRTLLSYEDPPFVVLPQQMLVDEEIKKRKLDYDREKLRSFKRKKLLAAQIAKLSFEWDLNDFAKKGCEFVLADTWDVKNSLELIIAQGHCCLFMAQIKIDELYQSSYEPLFQEEQIQGLNEQKKKQIKDKKGEVIQFLKKGLQYALSTQQSYLIFNGAICLWNNFLHIFRVNSNDSKLRADLPNLLKEYFQAMRNNLREVETKGLVYYDLDDKIQAFSNIGLVYARILQALKQTPLVQKVCEDLLLTNLSPNTRKLINGIKARVSGGKAGTGAKPADPKKGAPIAQKLPGFNDTFILEINNQLELIQNTTNKTECQNLIIKCFEGLQSWKPNQQDECELQLHAELWVKLARLSSNEGTPKLLKFALRCSQKALVQGRMSGASNIPSNRLRWYSLAQFISSEALLKLVNPKSQQSSSVEGLLFLSLSRGVQAAAKGFKCGINILVIDASKQVWNVCAQLQQSRSNRNKIIKPLRDVLNYLKDMKEDSEPDLILLLSQLYFRCTWENGLYQEGEQIADIMLEILPKGLQKSVWQAKMGFMSKQGKNELQAISSIKQAQPSLQAKLWVKLARIAPNSTKQQAAYSKALQILKKEHSVQIVQVLIEYSEWQLRVGKESLQNVIKNLQYASTLLIEIECDNELDDEEVDDQNTLNSHSRSKSHRSKRSAASKSMKSSQKDFKKDKKPTISNKSKVSGISRMNRSGRATKTIKNKNTKSVFSQREQDPNPDSLNCLHFERLFRIFTILASIHSQANQKMTYALNAYKQVLNMLRKSITTFNELQQNAAKLNDKQDKSTFKILKAPESIDEWINYELPRQYIQKIDKVQNFNFLGPFTIEKPELTYTYLLKLIYLFEDLGLSYQSIPLKFVAKYLAKYIIKNEQYGLLQEIKLKKNLLLCKHPLENTIKINMDDFKITEEEAKEQLLKAEYQKTNVALDNTNQLEQYQSPNIIQPLSKYAFWLEAAKIMVDFGQVSLSKSYLKESLKCAKVVGNSDNICKIHILLCEIAFLEGENQEAIQHLSLAHRLCKSSIEWQKIVLLASKVMSSIKKLDMLKSFLAKVNNTIGDLIEQNLKQAKQRSSFKTEVHQLKQLSLSVNTSLVHLGFKMLLDQNNHQNQVFFTTCLTNLEKLISTNTTTIWNISNFQKIIQVFQEILSYFQNRESSQVIDLNQKHFQTIFSTVKTLQKLNKGFVGSMGLSQMTGGSYNFIIDVQIRLGFILINCYCIDFYLFNGQVQGTSQNDLVLHNNEKISLYLQQINKQIRLKQKPIASELNQLQKALTIINQLEAHIPDTSYHYPRLVALQTFVITLMNSSSEEALDCSSNFRVKHEQRLQKFEVDINCHYYQAKVFQSITEQMIEVQSSDSFQYLSKLQQACSIEEVFKFLKKKMNANHKFVSTLRLIQSTNCIMNRQGIIQKQRLFSSLTKFPKFDDCMKLVPKNSIYVILQLNKIKNKMYFGLMVNETDPATRKCSVRAKQISSSELKAYIKLSESILAYKKLLTKTPFDDPNKLSLLIEQNQEKLKQIKSNLQSLSVWWLKQLIQILKTPKPVANVTNEKDKKGAKDQKKKGGKDQIAGYQSPITPSPSGIESVTFLLDGFLYNLPFEQLLTPDLISTVSKDNSVFWLSRKLQQIGFQSELNNSSGFGSDKGKYFGYDFKSAEMNFKNISLELSKGAEGLKLQGIDSGSRLPSLGDYSEAILKPGFLQIYGNIDFLNHLKVSSLMEYVGASKVRLLVVHDNLNFSKSILTKYKDLNNDAINVLIEQNERSLAIIANLFNLSLVKNRWVSSSNSLLSQTKQFYKSLASGIYIGAAVRQSRKESDKLNSEWMCYLHGPSIIRI